MRHLLVGVVGGLLLLAAARQAAGGDTFAMALVVGLASPLPAIIAAVVIPAKPQPLKADPVKVARLEVDLQTGPAWEEEQRRQQSEALTDVMADPATKHGVQTGCVSMLLVDPMLAEAYTPEVDECPRPEACVIAHPCRACGAGRGEACTPRNPHAVALRDVGERIDDGLRSASETLGRIDERVAEVQRRLDGMLAPEARKYRGIQ